MTSPENIEEQESAATKATAQHKCCGFVTVACADTSCDKAENLAHNAALLFLRLGIGLMTLTHGLPKLALLLHGQSAHWLNPIGIGSTASLILCICAEVFGSIGVILGFYTRASALLLFINFYIIVFMVGSHLAWSDRELAALYLLCYASLLGLGGGKYTINRVLCR